MTTAARVAVVVAVTVFVTTWDDKTVEVTGITLVDVATDVVLTTSVPLTPPPTVSVTVTLRVAVRVVVTSQAAADEDGSLAPPKLQRPKPG